MNRETQPRPWLAVLLLSALLLAGCARGERLRSGNPEGASSNPTAPQIEQQSATLDSDAQELDQLLADLEDELKNTDTNVAIP